MKGVLVVLSFSVLLLGCNDAKQAPAGSSSSATPVVTAPADYLGSMAQAQQKATKTVDLVAINKAIESFYVHEGRFPKSLAELEDKGFIRALPPGIKLNYDTNSGVVRLEKSLEPDGSLAPAK
jgi:hypothetical protein